MRAELSGYVYLSHNVSYAICVQDVNNPILKEIISSGPVSVTACILVYCIVTPFLEETVYRGFLLTYLASTMEWQQAVIISSAVFSAAHLSGENFVQLFIIGSVLGCSYCWTGKLSSSIVIHSMYNALTLLITFTSWLLNLIIFFYLCLCRYFSEFIAISDTLKISTWCFML